MSLATPARTKAAGFATIAANAMEVLMCDVNCHVGCRDASERAAGTDRFHERLPGQERSLTSTGSCRWRDGSPQIINRVCSGGARTTGWRSGSGSVRATACSACGRHPVRVIESGSRTPTSSKSSSWMSGSRWLTHRLTSSTRIGAPAGIVSWSSPSARSFKSTTEEAAIGHLNFENSPKSRIIDNILYFELPHTRSAKYTIRAEIHVYWEF